MYSIIATLNMLGVAGRSLMVKGNGRYGTRGGKCIMRLPDVTVGDDNVNRTDEQPRNDYGTHNPSLLAFEFVIIADLL